MTAPAGPDGNAAPKNDTGTAPDDQNTKDPDRSTDADRTGQNLDRDALEIELKRARDDAAKYRKKAEFAFPDSESYRRAKDALDMLDKVEEEKKSTEQRLTERNEQLMYEAATSQKEALRLRVALRQGIDADRVDEFASRLRGDTEDEMTADAEHLARFFAPAKPERRSDPSQGAGADSRPADNPLKAALEAKLGISR